MAIILGVLPYPFPLFRQEKNKLTPHPIIAILPYNYI